MILVWRGINKKGNVELVCKLEDWMNKYLCDWYYGKRIVCEWWKFMYDFKGNLICKLCFLNSWKGFIGELEYGDLKEWK